MNNCFINHETVHEAVTNFGEDFSLSASYLHLESQNHEVCITMCFKFIMLYLGKPKLREVKILPKCLPHLGHQNKNSSIHLLV